MMFTRAVLFLSFVRAVSASSFNTNSKAGQKLLQSSRKLNNNDNARDISWMPDYSIKFKKCHSLIQIAGGGENGGGNDNEGGSALYTQHMVEFSLCPSDTCTDSSCGKGGTYISNMREFAEMYLEYKKEELERQCENIKENCYNDDENYCYQQAGMYDCIEDENENGNNQDEDMEKYMECQLIEQDDNDNNNNNYNWNYNNGNGYQYREFYVGPQCNDKGSSINIAVFLDAGCSIPADEGTYEKISGGYSLPYSSKSIIGSECISCQNVDENDDNNNNNNNNDDNAEVEVNELCEQAYENAGRCESKMSITYPDETACNFINDLLPKMEGIRKSILGSGNGTVAVAFAWTFGVAAVLLGFYSFLLYRRLRRSKVSLNSEATGALA